MDRDPKDSDSLIQEKYGGNREAEGVAEDLARLAKGEPLAYVIGHQPFLGVSVSLHSHPLIPRPETEWWTELLIQELGTKDVSMLDLCAGSGAIGLAVLKHCPNATVSFGEVVEEHGEDIRSSIESNKLDASRADIRIGDLFKPFQDQRFAVIATNPPYIPEGRVLDTSVSEFEPHAALFSGADGLTIIKEILKEAPTYLLPQGEVWMECDVENIEQASAMALEGGADRTEIRTDQYGRPRLLVAYYAHATRAL